MSNKEKNGGPAFPVAGSEHNYPIEGMTLRDFFAAKAMQGDWAAEVVDGRGDSAVIKSLARGYYRMADAMLEAREDIPASLNSTEVS